MSGAWPQFALPLLALTVGVGCAPGTPPSDDEPPLQGVVLVLYDTLRADRLSSYGHTRPTSPEIDALAAAGVRFEQVVSSAPWTLPSVSALLAGKYSERVWEEGKLTESIVERLSASGLETAAFTEGGFFSRHFDHDRGFAHYVEEEGAVQLLGKGQARDGDKPGDIERTFAAAEAWLDAVGDRRFFLLIHTYEPHAPYSRQTFVGDAPRGRLGDVFDLDDVAGVRREEMLLEREELEYLSLLYDGGVHHADAFLGGLRRKLDALGLSESVALVVTSDHGEELGERYPHNVADHGHALLDTQLRVPLVIHDPRREYARKTIPEQMRLIDVMPTIADLLRVAVADDSDGRSLLPAMRGDEREERTALAGQTKSGPLRVAIRWKGYKYIRTVAPGRVDLPLNPEPPPAQLYDLTHDPEERVNLADRRPEMVRLLDDELRRIHPGVDRTVDPAEAGKIDPELLERLRSLGYLR